MAPRARDPGEAEIAELCRQFRLNWSAEEREEALSYAPTAAVTDAADQIYLDRLAVGEELSFDECLAELNSQTVRVELTPRLDPYESSARPRTLAP